MKEIENEMQGPKTYYQDVENKILDPETVGREFQEGVVDWDLAKKSRRDFLKIMGFTFAASPLATSCLRIPTKKAIPYLQKSDQVTMGVPEWYATTFDSIYGGHLLVKTREGRPIKVEGNALSPVTFGAASAYDQAALLGLYDSHRFRGPAINGQDATWEQVDAQLISRYQSTLGSGKKIYLITPPVSSPTNLKVIGALPSKVEHVVFWPDSLSTTDDLHNRIYGEGSQTHYSLKNVKVVLGFNGDFLGTMPYALKYTKEWAQNRDLRKSKQMISHLQLESVMSLTGSNADYRATFSHAEEEATMASLLAEIQAGLGFGSGAQAASVDVKNMASRLVKNKGAALIITGSTSARVQAMTALANELLGAYREGHAVVTKTNHYRGYNAQKFQGFLEGLEAGDVGGVILWDTNLLYQLPGSLAEKVKTQMSKVGFVLHLTDAPNETTAGLQGYVMPTHHQFESWGDHFTSPGTMSWSQPLVRPLFNTRMAQDSLLKIAGGGDFEDLLKRTASNMGVRNWDQALHDGVTQVSGQSQTLSFNADGWRNQLSASPKASAGGIQLVAYQKMGMRLGKMSNNPWLQEMPDPITKATWDNYFLIGPKHATSLGVKTGDILSVSLGNMTLELPAMVQPGMGKDTLAVAYGYGRSFAGKVADGIGVNAFSFSTLQDGRILSSAPVASITKTSGHKVMAQTQTHHSMENRPIVKETTLNEYVQNPRSGNEVGPKVITLWQEHKKEGEQWALLIDLNKCTGCSACVVSCNAENNVPVVGRQEVVNRRELHWIRLDRYYAGDDENPEVVHQPVMCQHCNNAPCETVCPVIATAGSSDGLNQQVYNRCVGTRYCANNCPFKVRRFNWFEYPHEDEVQKMVLNPDVVVRGRGVMEKCSMCIQRIQAGRLQAKMEGRDLHDGDIKLACEQSCPADALVFGNMNDEKSRVAGMLRDERNYRLFDEYNFQARVNYLTKVRNKS